MDVKIAYQNAPPPSALLRVILRSEWIKILKSRKFIMKIYFVFLFAVVLVASCGPSQSVTDGAHNEDTIQKEDKREMTDTLMVVPSLGGTPCMCGSKRIECSWPEDPRFLPTSLMINNGVSNIRCSIGDSIQILEPACGYFTVKLLELKPIHNQAKVAVHCFCDDKWVRTIR